MFEQARDSLARHKALQKWWADAPEPAVGALIVACIASGLTGSEAILSHIRAIAGENTAATAERLLSRSAPLWSRRWDLTYKLSPEGGTALWNEHVANWRSSLIPELL